MKKWRLHLAVLLVSLTTLVYELSLMRVFSVTIWNYLAFFVISVALLGGSVAAAIIFIRRPWFEKRIKRLLPWALILFSLLCALMPAIYINSGIVVEVGLQGILSLMLIVLIFFLPFLVGGFIIAAIFSFNSKRIGSLYWADLAGAALGCLAVIPLLNLFTAPNLLAWIALLPAAGALLLRSEQTDEGERRHRRRKNWAAGAVIVLVALAAASQLIMPGLYTIKYAKGTTQRTAKPTYVHWNHLARLTTYKSIFFKDDSLRPFGWGMSSQLGDYEIEQYWIEQDDSAGTPITSFNGNIEELDFLPYDVTNAAYSMSDYDSALVIGGGGGRDILAARYFGVPEITAVEINPGMVEIVEEVFPEFSGKPYSLPGVTGVVDEARSFLTRHQGEYDLIMISMIDSWAATMAGAFALSENNLYTREAVNLYLDHLSEDGVLTLSRWYVLTDHKETHRLTNLVATALENRGVDNPGEHMAVVGGGLISTVITRPRPYTSEEISALSDYIDRMGFQTLWLPDGAAEDDFLAALLTGDRDEVIADSPVDLSAPTDDQPFFFMFTDDPLGVDRTETEKASLMSYTVLVLRRLFYIMIGLALLLIILPLALKKKEPGEPFTLGRVLFKQTRQWLYFAAIGLGFMLVELALIQRYVLFLGHPSYATTVVIFSILIFAGLGSATTVPLTRKLSIRKLQPLVFGAIGLLVLFQAFLVPAILDGSLLGAALGWRIALSILLLAPLGFVMGMALPLGIRRLDDIDAAGMVPYVWGINGVFSVFASVLSIIIALSHGYTAGLLVGLGAYLIALLCSLGSWRRKVARATAE